MTAINQLLSRARLLKTAPEDVVPYGMGILRAQSTAGAGFEASLWPPEEADAVDIGDDEDEDDDTSQPDDVYDAEAGTAAVDLHTLCEAIVTHTATALNDFITEALPAPTGARAVGCILLLADSQDSARFWWQYAAGAGDNTAGYCLYLHHLARGETLTADWWRSQTRVTTDPTVYTVAIPTARSLVDSVTINAKISTILRTLRALTDTPRRWSAMVSDITAYVHSAVAAATCRETALPVPESFARDLRAVLADAARYESAAAAPGPGRVQPPRVLVGEWLDS